MNISGGSGHSGSQDFDLNLAPIIDCFTVLIAFMLVSASFVSIGLLDAGISAAGKASDSAPAATVQASLELQADKTIVVKVLGTKDRAQKAGFSVKPNGTEWNIEALAAKLREIKAQWPGIDSATLSAQNSVDYQSVVRVMDTTRQTLPSVLLGGF